MFRREIRRCLWLFLLCIPVFCPAEISVEPIPGLANGFIRGADVSMLSSIEEHGGKFYDRSGMEADALAILRDNGVNWIRLRLWNDPVDSSGQGLGGGDNDLERTILMATRAKKLGLKLLLDFHYSDFWADPGKQTKPRAWQDLSPDELADAVYRFTFDSLKALAAAGAFPDMVQIGNETNGGMLWPEGKTWQANPAEKIGGYDGFSRLLSAGARAVRDATPKGKRVRVAIHLANGGDNTLYRSVFDELVLRGVDFDVIGLSWYPYWHGPLKGLAANLADLSARYGKELVVMETAYAHTLADGDDTGNLFQMATDADGGYLPTAQGQATILRNLMATVATVPQKKGIGVFYWEPCWIPVPGVGWKAGEGDSWENQAMFDYSGNALDSLSVFKMVYGKKKVSPAVPVSAETVKLSSVIGDPLRLPQKVMVTYSDDSIRPAIVLWESFFPEDQDESGTVTVNGRLRDADVPARLEITFTRLRNLFPDPSFESGTLNGWTLDGPSAACFAESNAANAHSGKWTYKYWLDKPFRAVLSYTFTGIPTGRYTASCWAMGGGGDKSLSIVAKDFSGTTSLSTKIVNTGWQVWKEYSIPGIPVQGNQCTICIIIESSDGTWGNFDDIKFYREDNQ